MSTASDAAQLIFTDLVGAANDGVPPVNLEDSRYTVPWQTTDPMYQAIAPVTVTTVTDAFSAIQASMAAALQTELTAGRITGTKYAEVYMALTQASQAAAVQFALGKDAAYWAAVQGQAAAIQGLNQAELAKQQVAVAQVQYANGLLQLALQDSQVATSEYTRTELLPQQLALLESQVALTDQQKISFIEKDKSQASKILLDFLMARLTLNEGIGIPPNLKTETGTPDDPGLALYDALAAELAATAAG